MRGLIDAALFVLSSGIFFSGQFRHKRHVVLLAGILAIISGIFTVVQVYDLVRGIPWVFSWELGADQVLFIVLALAILTTGVRSYTQVEVPEEKKMRSRVKLQHDLASPTFALLSGAIAMIAAVRGRLASCCGR